MLSGKFRACLSFDHLGVSESREDPPVSCAKPILLVPVTQSRDVSNDVVLLFVLVDPCRFLKRRGPFERPPSAKACAMSCVCGRIPQQENASNPRNKVFHLPAGMCQKLGLLMVGSTWVFKKEDRLNLRSTYYFPATDDLDHGTPKARLPKRRARHM